MYIVCELNMAQQKFEKYQRILVEELSKVCSIPQGGLEAIEATCKKILSHTLAEVSLPLSDVDTELESEEEPDHSKNNCIANVCKNNDIRQCSRGKRHLDYCLIHYNQYKAGTLKHGTAKNTDVDKLTSHRHIVDKLDGNVYISVQRLVLRGTEYKYNPDTGYVYDFYSNKYIGKLDNSFNIIRDYDITI